MKECCVGKDYDNWCGEDGFSATYQHKGKDYCIFHFPAQKIKYEGKEFSEYVREYISNKMITNKKCDLRGTEFISHFHLENFKNNKALKDIDFRNCRFRSGLKFVEVDLDSKVLMQYITIENSTYFIGCNVKYEIDFTGINLEKAIYFDISNCIFEEKVNMSYINFPRMTSISSTEFNKSVSFVGSVFKGITCLKEHEKKGKTKFNKGVDFSGVKFEEDANFNYVEFCDAKFKDSEFKGLAYFKSTIFKESADFNKVLFIEDAYFNSFNSNQQGSKFINCIGEFGSVVFNKTAMFHKSVGDGLNFTETIFKGKTYFTRLNHKNLDLENTKFKEWVSFARSKINERADFIGANFEEYVSFYETILSGMANFDLCVFEKEVDFQRTRFEENKSIDTNAVSFKGAVFKKFIIF